MDTSHTLFQSVWIPWNVPVDKQATELEIDTLASRICTDENLHIGRHKAALSLTSFIYGHTTMNGCDRIAIVAQSLLQIEQGILMLGEDDQFLPIHYPLRGKQMF